VKKILFLVVFVLAFLAFNLEVQAAPFVVSDAYPTAATQPDGFAVSLDGGPVVEAPADPVTSSTVRFKFDVGGVSAGNHTIKVKAFVYDATWGRVESAEAVFTFARPAAPAVPGGLQLAP
jgi:hypothetical protein